MTVAPPMSSRAGRALILAGFLANHGLAMQEDVGPFRLVVDEGEVPVRAVEILESARPLYERLFDVKWEERLTIRLFRDAEHADYDGDYFDPEGPTSQLHWSGEDPAYDEWLLVHELAHAFQWALDPKAYAEEPSWIHEGWAEHAAWAYYRARDPEEAQRFLVRQARAYLKDGLPFDKAFRHVYSVPWKRAYPGCQLAVYLIETEHGGPSAVRDYFRVHGRGDAKKRFEKVLGVTVKEHARRVQELARRLVDESDDAER